MSSYATTAVFRHSQSRGNDRLVLLVIADRADDNGGGCWRARESIAGMAGVSVRTVTRSIAALVALGELDVTARPGTSNEYRIMLPGLDDPGQSVQGRGPRSGQQCPEGRDNGDQGVGTTVSRETSSKQPGDIKELSTDPFTADFNAWYAGYPRHDGRRAAHKVYVARRREGVSAERLTRARDNYARTLRGTEKRFVKMPSTFLAGRDGEDGPWQEAEKQSNDRPDATVAEGDDYQPTAEEWLAMGRRDVYERMKAAEGNR